MWEESKTFQMKECVGRCKTWVQFLDVLEQGEMHVDNSLFKDIRASGGTVYLETIKNSRPWANDAGEGAKWVWQER